MPETRVVVDCGSGETEYVDMTQEEEAQFHQDQAAGAAQVEAEEREREALQTKQAEMVVLADKLKAGGGTDADRARALELLLETNPLVS